MASQLELCDLVTAWLNHVDQQSQVSETFTATYDTHGYVDQPAAGQLYVIVTSGVRSSSIINRRPTYEKPADVVITVLERINKKTDVARTQRERELIALQEEIENLLLGLDFPEYQREEEASSSIPLQYGRPDMYESSVFNGDITTTFRYEVVKSR